MDNLHHKYGQSSRRVETGQRVKRSTIRGVAAVEYALLLVPMLIMCFGVVEYGRVLYHYNMLAKSVRDAVRILAQANPSDASYPMAAARCLAVYGNTTCSGSPLVTGLATSHVIICDRVNFSACGGIDATAYSNVPTAVGTINLVEVRIQGFTFSFIGLPFVAGSDPLTFGSIRNIMRQI